jgi:hypothetical protein
VYLFVFRCIRVSTCISSCFVVFVSRRVSFRVPFVRFSIRVFVSFVSFCMPSFMHRCAALRMPFVYIVSCCLSSCAVSRYASSSLSLFSSLSLVVLVLYLIVVPRNSSPLVSRRSFLVIVPCLSFRVPFVCVSLCLSSSAVFSSVSFVLDSLPV